jgi:hypothetical protein
LCAASSKNDIYYALLSENQRQVKVYTYSDVTEIMTYESENPIFLMEFSADSTYLLVVSGARKSVDEPKDIYNISIIIPSKQPKNELVNPSINSIKKQPRPTYLIKRTQIALQNEIPS